jgi:hypothetical protein
MSGASVSCQGGVCAAARPSTLTSTSSKQASKQAEAGNDRYLLCRGRKGKRVSTRQGGKWRAKESGFCRTSGCFVPCASCLVLGASCLLPLRCRQ